MNRCCEQSVAEGQRWQYEEGEVECEWCGTYITVEKPPPDPDAYLFEPYFTNEPLSPEVLAAVEQRREAGDFIKIPEPRTLLNGRLTAEVPQPTGKRWSGPTKVGVGPPPPRAPSPARAALRQFLVEELGGDSQALIDGSVGLIADIVSFALERRHQAKIYEAGALLVDIENLLDLIKDESPEKWETITLTSIDVAPPYTAVGFVVDEDRALSVAITGRENDPAAEDLASFFEDAPRVLNAVKSCLREPL